MTMSPQGTKGRDLLEFKPEPLQARIIDYDPEEGECIRGFHVTWWAREGERCRLCPKEKCTLKPVPESGTATCFRVLKGDASDRLARVFDVDSQSG